jgi:tripartite-type tricarboxylate transporter receptor subunit TctC
LIGSAWLGATSAHALEYPSKPVHIVVPTAPGGGNDLVARLLAAFLQARLGQTFVVDNKPGAQNLVGTKYVALAPGDGYTLLVSASISSFPVFNKDPGFEVAKDLAFISPIMRAPQVLAVNAARPYHSVADLSAISQADPGKLNFTSYGFLPSRQPMCRFPMPPRPPKPSPRATRITFLDRSPPCDPSSIAASCDRSPSQPTSATQIVPIFRPCARPG